MASFVQDEMTTPSYNTVARTPAVAPWGRRKKQLDSHCSKFSREKYLVVEGGILLKGEQWN